MSVVEEGSGGYEGGPMDLEAAEADVGCVARTGALHATSSLPFLSLADGHTCPPQALPPGRDMPAHVVWGGWGASDWPLAGCT
jgi:hypothetical protein